MYRIDNATAISPIPAPAAVGPNPGSFFTKGNPGTGTPATIVDDDWANAVQEEIANAIEGFGIVLSKTNRSQLLAAIQGIGGYGRDALADTGAANAYAIAASPAITAYANGQRFSFKPANTNTAASTLNVNAVGAKSIVRADGTALLPSDIIAAGLVTVIYSSVLDKFVLQTLTALQGTGRFRVPGTPFYVQWVGYSLTPATTTNCPTGSVWGNVTVTWPIAFPNAGLAAWAGPIVSANGQYTFASTAALSATTAIVYHNVWNTATMPVTGIAFAIGN